MSLNSVLEQLREFPVIPIVRTSTPELAATAIEWLSEAGLRTFEITMTCLLYTSPSPRDYAASRMPSSA